MDWMDPKQRGREYKIVDEVRDGRHYGGWHGITSDAKDSEVPARPLRIEVPWCSSELCGHISGLVNAFQSPPFDDGRYPVLNRDNAPEVTPYQDENDDHSGRDLKRNETNCWKGGCT